MLKSIRNFTLIFHTPLYQRLYKSCACLLFIDLLDRLWDCIHDANYGGSLQTNREICRASSDKGDRNVIEILLKKYSMFPFN